MEWMEVTVHTVTQGSDIVSMMLMQQGAAGTAIEDRADVPDPTKPHGYWELIDQSMIDAMPEDVLVKAWLPVDERLPDRLSALGEQLLVLPGLTPDIPLGSLQLETSQVDEQDWAECWKKFYKPFRASRSLVVKPTWEPYEKQPGDKVIELDPGMAFGTGTHETTALCLSLLEDYVTPGMNVMDVGTGSGILAIGAALLGARDVLAIDIDPEAVRVARENVTQNKLDQMIRVAEGDLTRDVKDTFDLCTANILADVIIMLATPLKDRLTPGGLFICSGIIIEREQDVLDGLAAAGYTLLEKQYRGAWVALVSRRG
jgi:ribosomal protein L11 methyltransferase